MDHRSGVTMTQLQSTAAKLISNIYLISLSKIGNNGLSKSQILSSNQKAGLGLNITTKMILMKHFMVAAHTWLRGPLKNRNAPFPLKDSDRELIHAISRQGVYHHSPLGAVLVLPACWLTLLPVPDCVRSKFRDNGHIWCCWGRLKFPIVHSYPLMTYRHMHKHIFINPTWMPRVQLFPSPQQGQPRRWGLT